MHHQSLTPYRPAAGSAPSAVSMTQAVVAHTYGVALEELRAATRKTPRAARARQVAMYLSHVVLHLSLREVAEAFGRDRSTASYACHHIEDLREDPAMDRTLGWLESFVRSAAGARL